MINYRPSFGESKRPLRVLFYLFFPGGGIGKYTHELLRELVKYDDLDIEVVCPPDFAWKEDSPYRTWPHVFDIGHKWPLVRRMRFLIGQFVSPLRLFDRARQMQADIVHVCNINYLTFPFWRRSMQRTRAAVAISAHDIRRGQPILHRRWEERQLAEIYRSANALFVHSQAQVCELEEFAQVPTERVCIVPHGPYEQGTCSDAARMRVRKEFGCAESTTIGLQFGQIRDDKGIDRSLRAWTRLPDAYHLVIAGRGGARGHRSVVEYRRLVENLGLDNRVTFIERFVPDEEISALFAAADFVLLPYDQQFSSQSGVLNLSGSYRRPMVVTPAPTIAESVRAYRLGRVSSDYSSESLSGAILALFNDIRTGAAFGFDDFLRENTWAENARRTREIYRAIADSVRCEP